MPIDFPSSPTQGQLYSYGGVTYTYTAQGVWVTAGASAVGIIGGSPQGRLTLQTGTPVMTTTQSAKTTIYYTPYVGDRVPIYDGTNMVMTTFTELSVATTNTTKSPAAIGASKINDWFVWNDAGTVRLGHGPDWTNDTTRSAGTALVMVNGILLNSVSLTNGPAASRGTYVGTTRSNASSQLDWIYGTDGNPPTASVLGVWNMYNRIDVASSLGITAVSWSYAGTTPRVSNNATATARISYVLGLAEDMIEAKFESVSVRTGASGLPENGILHDSATIYSGYTSVGTNSGASSQASGCALFNTNIDLGFHFVSPGESVTADTHTYVGVSGNQKSGITLIGRF